MKGAGPRARPRGKDGMERIPMTPDGYEQAVRKLRRLKDVELPRVEKALGAAREMGDLAENAEFDAAREELWNLERQIAELERRISLADVIDPSRSRQDGVAIGALVRLEDAATGLVEDILLVGEGEIRSGVDTVSVASPLGRALLGKKSGQTVEVDAPGGKLRYKIVDYRYE